MLEGLLLEGLLLDPPAMGGLGRWGWMFGGLIFWVTALHERRSPPSQSPPKPSQKASSPSPPKHPPPQKNSYLSVATSELPAHAHLTPEERATLQKEAGDALSWLQDKTALQVGFGGGVRGAASAGSRGRARTRARPAAGSGALLAQPQPRCPARPARRPYAAGARGERFTLQQSLQHRHPYPHRQQ